ncbi:MAG: nucleotidyltransferase [Candidatus Omnitrophica bacterium]|nr:nucleotidyltransferase [Candidatus Omnitrophota bacterium]
MTISNIILEALKAMINILEISGIDYCLFGGLAMQAYKHIRATMDVDLMLAIDSKQISNFILKLEKEGFKFDRNRGIAKIGDFEFLRFIYTDKKQGIDIYLDLVTLKTDFQNEIIRRKQKIDLFGFKVNIASCEDLILLKILSGRMLDRADVQALIEANKQELDRDYLKVWARKLGTERELTLLMKGDEHQKGKH